MTGHRFLRSQRGSASVEFALVLPMLIVLMFGGLEAGYFMWMQHRLTDAVRDGARFAARMSIDDFCSGTPDFTEAEQLTKSSMPKWPDAVVTVTPHCGQFVSTGIYSDLGTAGPIVTVSVNAPYHSLFSGLGSGLTSGITLHAATNAPVIGI